MPRWKLIEDLPEDWEKLRSSHLEGLLSIWRQRYEKLKDSEALREFNSRLQREWAIETGIIEGLYTLDRGTTNLLIEHGIIEDYLSHEATNRPVPQVIGMLKDHESALEGVFEFVGHGRELSTSYIKEVHAALTRHQETVAGVDAFGRRFETPLLRGEWKRLPNNPTRHNGGIHEYCPPEHVAAEMDRMIAMHREHQERGVPPEIEAAWLHHRFTQIHPFQDGNGRVARLLASLIFLRAGGFPVSIHRDIRAEYIDSLEEADGGDLNILVELFVRLQVKAIEQAIIVEEPIRDFSEMLEAIAERLQNNKEDKKPLSERLLNSARLLSQEAYIRLEEVQRKWQPILETSLGIPAYSLHIDSPVTASRQGVNQVYQSTLGRIADEIGYLVDIRIYWSWVRLNLSTENIILNIVVAFHGIGEESTGLLASTVFVQWEKVQQVGITYPQFHPASTDVFTFSDHENEEDLVSRFRKWLTPVILTGLDQWRRLL